MNYKNIDDICKDIDLWRFYAIKIAQDKNVADEILSEVLEILIHLYIRYPHKILYKAYIYTALESRFNKRFEKPNLTVEFQDWMECADEEYDKDLDIEDSIKIDLISEELNHSPTKKLWADNTIYKLINQDDFSQCELSRRTTIHRSRIKIALDRTQDRIKQKYNDRYGKED